MAGDASRASTSNRFLREQDGVAAAGAAGVQHARPGRIRVFAEQPGEAHVGLPRGEALDVLGGIPEGVRSRGFHSSPSADGASVSRAEARRGYARLMKIEFPGGLRVDAVEAG
jgi:hypothetical protein